MIVDLPDWPSEPQPQWVMQWFPPLLHEPGGHYGVDPRQHAVASSFLVTVASEPAVRTGSDAEAEDFAWFAADALPQDLWPGTDVLIGHLLRSLENKIQRGTPLG